MKYAASLTAMLAAALLICVSSAWAQCCGTSEAQTEPAKAAVPPEQQACDACMAPAELAKPSTAAEKPAEKATVKAEAEINTSGLKALITAKAQLILLDARSGKWDDKTRIPGAVSLAPDARDEDVAKLLPDKNALIVTYCSNLQCPASGMLAAKLRKIGYVNVIEYSEGIAGWKQAGHQVDTAK